MNQECWNETKTTIKSRKSKEITKNNENFKDSNFIAGASILRFEKGKRDRENYHSWFPLVETITYLYERVVNIFNVFLLSVTLLFEFYVYCLF